MHTAHLSVSRTRVFFRFPSVNVWRCTQRFPKPLCHFPRIPSSVQYFFVGLTPLPLVKSAERTHTQLSLFFVTVFRAYSRKVIYSPNRPRCVKKEIFSYAGVGQKSVFFWSKIWEEGAVCVWIFFAVQACLPSVKLIQCTFGIFSLSFPTQESAANNFCIMLLLSILEVETRTKEIKKA